MTISHYADALVFKEEWQGDYAFTEKNAKAVFLICDSIVNNFKVGNLKRHYKKLHPEFTSQYPVQSELRIKKLQCIKICVFKKSFKI